MEKVCGFVDYVDYVDGGVEKRQAVFQAKHNSRKSTKSGLETRKLAVRMLAREPCETVKMHTFSKAD